MNTTSKTLNESINEVMDSKMGRTNKVSALIELGLLDREARFIVRSYYANVTPIKREVRFKYTFGVEIECNVNYNLVTSDKVEFHREGYNHNTKKWFKFVNDGSVSGANAIECVSPVLNSTKGGFDALKACCDALNEQGARVNKSCGLHVHISTKNLTGEWFANVFHNYKMLENVIDSFMANSRKGNGCRWARTLLDHNFEGLTTFAEVQSQLCYDRYHKVNAEAYSRHRTIEFRQHQGSTDYEKISKWVEFLGKLVGFSKDTKFESMVESVDAIPFLNESEKAFFKARIEHFANA